MWARGTYCGEKSPPLLCDQIISSETHSLFGSYIPRADVRLLNGGGGGTLVYMQRIEGQLGKEKLHRMPKVGSRPLDPPDPHQYTDASASVYCFRQMPRQ